MGFFFIRSEHAEKRAATTSAGAFCEGAAVVEESATAARQSLTVRDQHSRGGGVRYECAR